MKRCDKNASSACAIKEKQKYSNLAWKVSCLDLVASLSVLPGIDVNFHAEASALVKETLLDDFAMEDFGDAQEVGWADFMLQLENELMQEMEAAQLEQLTQYEQESATAAIECASRVPCPVCQQAALQQLRNVIFCRCGLRLSLAVRHQFCILTVLLSNSHTSLYVAKILFVCLLFVICVLL